MPETIGAIAYCYLNKNKLKDILMGLVITTVGGPGSFSYKQSWEKDHVINKVIEEVLKEEKKDFVIHPFDIHGSDERQFSSPGFSINMSSLFKDKYYETKINYLLGISKSTSQKVNEKNDTKKNLGEPVQGARSVPA